MILGLAARWWLYASGRSPLDGDEAILGAMGVHMAALERLPLHFYGQHYMGSLEVPPLAFLQLLGPEAWKFSAIPIKLTATGFFVLLSVVHFRLCDRLFGRSVARWALFFLCVAPTFWIDYSLRLRHAVLMLALGEIAIGLALDAGEAWRDRGEVVLGRLGWLGFVLGLGFWHYQLIVVFFPAVAWAFFARAGFGPLRAMISRAGARSAATWTSRPSFLAVATLLLAAIACAFLASLPLGSLAGHWRRFGTIVGAGLAIFALPWMHAAFEARRAPGDLAARARFAPHALMGAFLLGLSPALLYLATLDWEFFLPPNPLLLRDLGSRLASLFMMEGANMLELTRSETFGSNMQVLTARTPFLFAAYALAAYASVRTLFRPSSPDARLGVALFLLAAASLILLNVLAPRPASWLRPRFLVPLFGPLSVAFGIAASMILAPLRSAEPRPAGVVGGVALVAGALALWLPGWRELPVEPLVWPSGHRAVATRLVAELEARHIERATFPRASYHVFYGYEYQFVARLRIRFCKGDLGDRMDRVLDESRFGGTLWMIVPFGEAYPWLSPDDPSPAALEDALSRAGGFRSDHYICFPVDESHHTIFP